MRYLWVILVLAVSCASAWAGEMDEVNASIRARAVAEKSNPRGIVQLRIDKGPTAADRTEALNRLDRDAGAQREIARRNMAAQASSSRTQASASASSRPDLWVG